MTVDIDIDDFWDEVSNDDILGELDHRISRDKSVLEDIRQHFDLEDEPEHTTLDDQLKKEELDKVRKILNWNQLRTLVHRLESGDIKL